MLWSPVCLKMNTHNAHWWMEFNMKHLSMDFQRKNAQKLGTLMQPLMSKPREEKNANNKIYEACSMLVSLHRIKLNHMELQCCILKVLEEERER